MEKLHPILVVANSNEDSKDNDLGNILSELEKLKSYLNNVELQLYEANEHISDLMEKATPCSSVFHLKDSKIFLVFTECSLRSREFSSKNRKSRIE